jgi:hypothetical protein
MANTKPYGKFFFYHASIEVDIPRGCSWRPSKAIITASGEREKISDSRLFLSAKLGQLVKPIYNFNWENME